MRKTPLCSGKTGAFLGLLEGFYRNWRTGRGQWILRIGAVFCVLSVWLFSLRCGIDVAYRTEEVAAMARRAAGEGNIRKRSDGRWEGRYVAGHDAEGKPIRKNVLGKTQAEAKEKLKAALEECQRLDVSLAGDRRDVLSGCGERHQQKDHENAGAGTHSLPRSAAHLRNHCAAKRGRHPHRLRHAGSRRPRLHPAHLHPHLQPHASQGSRNHRQCDGEESVSAIKTTSRHICVRDVLSHRAHI